MRNENNIVYTVAGEQHLSQLKLLWLTCFPEDSSADVDRFYDRLFSSIICLVGLINEQPVTVLHLLPARAYLHGVSYPVRYLYAGATHPDHRKRGYYAALLQYARSYVERIGECGIYLHPATERLIPLYKQAGYADFIVAGVPQPLIGKERPITLSAADYAKRRQEHIQRLAGDTVYFEPQPDVSEWFITGLFREGSSLYIDDGHLLLVKEGMTIDTLPPIAETYQTAMWLETRDEPLFSQAMHVNGGYTALLGE